MSQLLYGIICITVGILIFYKRPKWFFFYWLLFESLLFPIGCLLLGVINRDAFLDFYKYSSNCARNLLVIILIICFFKTRKFPQINAIWMAMFLLMTYLIFHSAGNHFEVVAIWGYFSQFVSILLVLLIILIDRNLVPDSRTIFKFISYFLVAQCLLVIANLNGYFVYITYYFPVIVELPTGAFTESFTENLAMGSFQSTNGLANFLTTIFLFMSLEFFSGNFISKNYYLLFSMMIGFMVLSSGSRASLVLFIIILGLSNLLYLKTNMKFFLVGSLVVVVSFFFLISYDSYGVDVNENGRSRILVGLSDFYNSSKDDDKSTVSLSTYLIDNYFYRSPIIGNGLAYKGEFAYGNKGVVGLSGFTADARLAFLLVEYGVVGFMLYMLFFISIFKSLKSRVSKNNRKKLIVCYIYFFILTITENGFFDRFNMSLLFIYSISLLTANSCIPILQASINTNRYVRFKLC